MDIDLRHRIESASYHCRRRGKEHSLMGLIRFVNSFDDGFLLEDTKERLLHALYHAGFRNGHNWCENKTKEAIDNALGSVFSYRLGGE